METNAALRIIRALSNGMDPRTGKIFSPDSPYQNPDTIRALFWAVRTLEGTLPQRPGQPLPENSGKPWSDDEDKALASEFDAGTQIGDIASAHKRSHLAIEARLARMGKITLPSGLPLFRRTLAPMQSAAQH